MIPATTAPTRVDGNVMFMAFPYLLRPSRRDESGQKSNTRLRTCGTACLAGARARRNNSFRTTRKRIDSYDHSAVSISNFANGALGEHCWHGGARVPSR
jgi:hypothetical protein